MIELGEEGLLLILLLFAFIPFSLPSSPIEPYVIVNQGSKIGMK